MKFIVRKAEEKDLNSLAALYDTRRDYPHSPYGREKREIFTKMLTESSRHLFVGEKNGSVCAFLSLRIENRLENFLAPDAVISDLKANDNDAEILCAIISRAIAVAMENECREITLSDRKITPEKHSLYSICGFRESNAFYLKQI